MLVLLVVVVVMMMMVMMMMVMMMITTTATIYCCVTLPLSDAVVRPVALASHWRLSAVEQTRHCGRQPLGRRQP